MRIESVTVEFRNVCKSVSLSLRGAAARPGLNCLAMATLPAPTDQVTAQDDHSQQAYISPLSAVRDFFESLTALRSSTDGEIDSQR